MIILAIETSCDETAASIVQKESGKISVLSNIVSSQIKLHAKWGGVVPNLAAREHLKNIIPIINAALKKACVQIKDIDALATTNGPGLIPALLIGANTAKTISYLEHKPLIGIHHIEGHIYANLINKSEEEISFPVLGLIVSGGHTQLILMRGHFDYELIGETQDDAAGEAFDKVARILGLPYPGGPAIANRAMKFNPEKIKFDIKLPRPMINSKDFNFSFSGLKTAVLYKAKQNQELLKDENFVNQMSCEFQKSVIDVLISKTISAALKYKPKTIILAGGVSANTELRRQLGEKIEVTLPDTRYTIPDTKYSLDNAAMIGAAACFRFEKEKDNKDWIDNWKHLSADANLKLTGL